eukprot:6256775-Alexandrium_andersonii.AAC.1
MSASLVGSEMCIRDSTSAGLTRTPCGRRPRSSSRLRLGWIATCSSSAVSYTHLTLPTICSV